MSGALDNWAWESAGPADGASRDDGREQAEQFYRNQSRRLISSLARRTGCGETARDIAQEAFARFYALTARQRFAIRHPEAYLRRISTNLLRNWMKGNALHHGTLDRMAEGETAQVDQLAYLESRDTLRRLEAAILSLKPKTRAIFLAHRIDGLSYREIADLTGLSVKGVEKQMSKAIAKIDRMLDRS